MAEHTHKTVRIIEICACGATSEDYGEWIERGQGNAAARELSMRRAPAVRKASAAIGGAARWKGSTAEERTAIMTAMATRPRGPRRKIEDRCACGKYSRALAERRKHKCKTSGG